MNTALTALIWVIATFLALIELLLVYRMFTGKIDLSDLISDGKQASLSRFQFLIFTFVIAVGILYLTVKSDAFPALDQGILILLGISGASYAVGKSLDNQASGTKSDTAASGGGGPPAAGGAPGPAAAPGAVAGAAAGAAAGGAAGAVAGAAAGGAAGAAAGAPSVP